MSARVHRLLLNVSIERYGRVILWTIWHFLRLIMSNDSIIDIPMRIGSDEYKSCEFLLI